MIQNGCKQVSSSIQPYSQQEYMTGFYIRQEWHFGAGGYYLQMYEFDGTPKPWLWLTYKPPQMLPTQQLKQEVSMAFTASLCAESFLGIRPSKQ